MAGATGTAEPNYYGQLASTDIDTITTENPVPSIWIVNRDGSAEIFYRTDGEAPAVGNAACGFIPAAITAVEIQTSDDAATEVQLISSGTPKYAIVGSDQETFNV
jgi:hypothetical protein